MRNIRIFGDSDESYLIHREHISKMRDYYAKTAHLYNTWHCNPQNDSSHNYAVGELVSMVDRLKARSVIDVCCGTGRATKKLLELGIDAQGIDLSPELIKIGVAEFGIPKTRLSVGDATLLPYKDQQFDIACILGALHHTARPRQVISELLRVSKLGVLISDEGNHLSGGIKSLLISVGLFDPIYRILFKRPPRRARRQINSEGDGPTFVFSVEEILPQVCDVFPIIKTLSFYRFGNFQTCAYWYPRLFARQVILIASN